ncbi:MAG: transcriptional repressor [Bacteroidia bacterium]|nr:transcriptional repressor [Bacteroidia bacterium]MDW8015465.1 transcriptional repressor [Bacteroidia bacterium]
MRCTQPRRCILEALMKGPKTHAELLKATKLDRITVYRNLIALQKIGLVYRVYLPGHDPVYVLCEGEGAEHAHFFCCQCRKGICLPSGTVQIMEPWASHTQRVLLVGQCMDCR